MTGYTLRENAPLVARNTFGIAASAGLLAEVRSAAGFDALFALPYLQQQPVLVLGEGSNLLFVGDFEGVVVSLAMPGIQVIEETAERVRVRAEAGERWDDLVRWSVARGYFGIENLALIPGSVGACPIQNIGAYGMEVAQTVAWVEAYDRERGMMVRLANADCRFGYRDSVFKRQPERWVIAAVAFDLLRQGELKLDYAGVREEIAGFGVDRPRPLHAAEAISRIRARKLPHPSLLGNAGSFFKNPELDAAAAAALQAEHAALPVFPAGPGRSKLSAAWLIEQCGWRGHRSGDAGVAEQHALVLVNHGHANGAQILDLARRIAESVWRRFGVALEPEPRLIGASW